jgi:hypothetical protein
MHLCVKVQLLSEPLFRPQTVCATALPMYFPRHICAQSSQSLVVGPVIALLTTSRPWETIPKENSMFAQLSYLVAGVALSLLVSGCQNSSPMTAQAAASPRRAIVVSGGNSGSYTVFMSSVDPNDPGVLCSAGTPVCPECKAAAIKYFQTGVLDPKCSRTGATRSAIVAVDEGVGHQ